MASYLVLFIVFVYMIFYLFQFLLAFNSLYWRVVRYQSESKSRSGSFVSWDSTCLGLALLQGFWDGAPSAIRCPKPSTIRSNELKNGHLCQMSIVKISGYSLVISVFHLYCCSFILMHGLC